MTLVQLEYVVAVDTFQHFAAAARHCFVTQPTLSMQIHKLEQELEIKIFDRSKQPVVPTAPGREFLVLARRVLAERDHLLQVIKDRNNVLSGELRLGIIPTLAPYLLPLFVTQFTRRHPNVRLTVSEMTTEILVARLREGRIDAGILVTPLQEKGIREIPLFYEELVAYVSRKNSAFRKTYVLPQDIDPNKLWLLEEGHCFRSQIVNLCELRKASLHGSHFEYEAGSVETLKRMVELNDGITILPELATFNLTARQSSMVRHFKKPVPVREVSLAIHRDVVKKKLVDAVQAEILAAIPKKMEKNENRQVVEIEEG